MSPKKKYECPECKDWWAVRVDGRLRMHKDRNAWPQIRCEGSEMLMQAPARRSLNQQEIATISLASLGWTDEAIARKFDLSKDTIRDRWKDIFFNTRTVNRTHAVADAVRRGVIF